VLAVGDLIFRLSPDDSNQINELEKTRRKTQAAKKLRWSLSIPGGPLKRQVGTKRCGISLHQLRVGGN
jgi:hypothetical protein